MRTRRARARGMQTPCAAAVCPRAAKAQPSHVELRILQPRPRHGTGEGRADRSRKRFGREERASEGAGGGYGMGFAAKGGIRYNRQ